MNRTSSKKISKQQIVSEMLLGFAIVTLWMMPAVAHAQSYGSMTTLLQGFAQWLFLSVGPYIFMIGMAISAIGVAKGWMPMKGAVVSTILCFVFFMIPTIVQYAKSQAAANI